MQGTITFDGTVFGGISRDGGGSSNVSITPTVTEGTKIADYEINGIPGKLYAPDPEAFTAQTPLLISNNVISIDLSGYQEKLTPGNYISIDSNNEISCTPPITNVQYVPEPEVQQDILIGKFTVNDVTQNVYVPSGGSSWNYATSEVNTRQKWIDNKDIYCCVIDNINDNNWHSIANLNINELLPTTNGYFITNNQYYHFNLYSESQYASYIQYDYTNKAILLNVIGWTTSKRVVVLFYTKSV